MAAIRLFGLAFCAGIINALSLAWPWSVGLDYGQPTWALQCAAMLGLEWTLLATRSARQAAQLGFVFQMASMVVSLSWLVISMNQYGGLPAPMAWAALCVLSAFLSLYTAVAAGTWKWLAPAHAPSSALLFGALWLASELARGQWLTGFGWANIAYAHIEGPFSPLVPWLGAYGISALLAGISTLLAFQLRKPTSKGLLSAMMGGGLWVGVATIGGFTEPTGRLSLALLQGNIRQDEKFVANTGVVEALDWYGKELRIAQADLILAPETAIPVLPQQLPKSYWEGWSAGGSVGPSTRLVGMPLGDARDGYTNSVIGFRTPEDVQTWYRYDKHHLVPFGEFIPPLFKWFVRMMNIPLGDFERGALAQASIEVRGERVAPAICFEDLFSEELAARFRSPQQAPTVLANFSNLAWFGDSTAMYQHLSISRMRSLEFGRPSMRVSNTGVTAIVDHDGTVVAALPPMTRGVLRGEVHPRSGMTPYAWWSSRWGQLPLWGIAIAVLAIFYFVSRRKSN